MMILRLLSLAVMVMILLSCSQVQENHSDVAAKFDSNQESNLAREKSLSLWPKIQTEVKRDGELEKRIHNILSNMTLEQKVAQMVQPEIRDITVEDMRRYGFGSFLNGGGAFPNNNKHSTPRDWIDLAEAMYQASIDDSLDGSQIPTMWGTDAVHGHNNVIGATLFPHNIGLGAMNNPVLMEQIAKATATEVMVTGIDWVFAPTVAAVRDDRWGRSYEGYSEHPEIIKRYASAVVRGLQGDPNRDFLADNRVISTVKHFIGDGGTVDGIDQGDNRAEEAELFAIHAQGYMGGLNAGAQTVMASFNSWKGKKIHGSHYLLTSVLKQQMGFDGFVVGDWNGHGQINGCTNQSCPQAINAGLDVFMVPTDAWKPLLQNTINQVKQGVISQQRIDDAVARILRVKLRAGIFDKPSPAHRIYSGKTELIGHSKHRAIARQAVRESLVLLKNNNQILPIDPTQSILLAGDGANNIGKQAGGWTITWQGTGNKNAEFPGATSIYQGLKNQVEKAGGLITLSENGEYLEKPDVAVVVFGENPYAEGQGDVSDLEFEAETKKSLKLLKKLKADDIPVVSLFISGRPMWINPELNASDAFVAVWLPGTEGEGIADVILKTSGEMPQHDFKGKLSFSWPNHPKQVVNLGDSDYQPLFKYGYGLDYQSDKQIPNNLDISVSRFLKNTGETNFESLNDKTINVAKHKLLVGGVKAPWSLKIFSGEQTRDVIANVQNVGNLAYRTVDKEKQEDAVRLTFKGGKESGLMLMSQSSLPQDLSSEQSLAAVLQFELKPQKSISDDLSVTINCVTHNECINKLRVNSLIDNSLLNQWQTIEVPLHCMKLAPETLKQIVVPFRISTSSENQFEIANIRLGFKKSNSVIFSC